MKEHQYSARVKWTGNLGTGTATYTGYSRNHVISIDGKPEVPGSSDAVFRGDKNRYSPEDSFLAALSACHMLWYLHLCADNKIVVEEYVDKPEGTMVENSNGSGQFTKVTLHPRVTIRDKSMLEKAQLLHHDAHKMCFLARSVNFPITHQPTIAAL